MKINNNMPITPIEQGDARRKPNAVGQGFEELLTEQLKPGNARASGTHSSLAGSGTAAALSLLLEAQQTQSGVNATADAQLADFVAGRVEGLLGSLDSYAEAMASPEASSLRSMYGMLESISGEVNALKSALPSLGEMHSGLAAMVNELDVITTTEQIKFNRGDYL